MQTHVQPILPLTNWNFTTAGPETGLKAAAPKDPHFVQCPGGVEGITHIITAVLNYLDRSLKQLTNDYSNNPFISWISFNSIN